MCSVRLSQGTVVRAGGIGERGLITKDNEITVNEKESDSPVTKRPR